MRPVFEWSFRVEGPSTNSEIVMISMLSKNEFENLKRRRILSETATMQSLDVPCPPPLGTGLRHNFNRKRAISTEVVITELPRLSRTNPHSPLRPHNPNSSSKG